MVNQNTTLIYRTQLCAKLSSALKNKKIIYIGCHTGWGKTTSVQSWLDKMQLPYTYLSACDDAFIENFYSTKFQKKRVIVLDDLYALQDAADINIFVEKIASTENKFILISRTLLPSYLKPFVITQQLETIGKNDLAFSAVETEQLFKQNDISYPFDFCLKITEKVKGWPLSISLLANRLKKEDYSEDVFMRCKWDIFDYFDMILLQKWDIQLQDFLMDICEFESFESKLAIMVTGRREATQYLKQLLSMGSFLKHIPPDNYVFSPLFREYLLKKQSELCLEEHVKLIYQNAALYYELEDDLPNAMKYYNKAGNVNKLSMLLIENANRHATNAQFYETERYYRSLPTELILRSPELMSAMSMMESLCCHPEESEKWYNCLEQYKNTTDKNNSSYKIAKEKILYLNIGLPHRGSMKIFDLIKNATEICMSGKLKLQEISVTGDMPSLMNGGKDFTEWSKNDHKIYGIFKNSMDVVFGKCGVGLADGAMGESIYEKCTSLNFTDALSYLNNGLSKAMLKGTTQMQFAIIGIMARVFIAQGSLDTAMNLICNFKDRCIIEKENSILLNVDAFIIRMNMFAGKCYEVERWMKCDAPDELSNLYILSRYQYLTKVRGYIVNERYFEALSLLNYLKIYYERYGRPYGLMETQMLYAIVLFRMKDERWQEEMTTVLKKCEEFGFTRLIADEGIAVFELLKKLNYDGDKKYFKLVVMLTREQAMRYPKYLMLEKKLKAELSPPEKTVLQLMAQGEKNNEIADFLSITVSTVKFHSGNIYAKLDVTNRSQAIKVAHELKLL